MIRSAPTIAAVNTKNSKAKNTESSLQVAENLGEQSTGLETGMPAGFAFAKKGFDLAQVPATPGLQTGLSVQCCAKDGGSCSCPRCKAKAESEEENENISGDAATFAVSATPEIAAQPAAEDATEGSETSSEQDAAQEQSGVLIVDEMSSDMQEGQMTKAQFLRELRESICDAIGPVLATAGQTTEGCPYLNYWLDLYTQKTAAETEATVHRYAPDSVGAGTAAEYISIVTERALRAAEVWARNGRITGIPEGVSTSVPGEPPDGPDRNTSQAAPVMTKAKAGGAKNANDPAAIQQELGDGEPLTSTVRSRMESAFGTSFSHVRTHTDSKAAGISNRVNARALTVGRHVAFGSEEYQPGTLIGDALIAHELAHVLQQKDEENRVNKLQASGPGYDELEKDADQAAVGAVASLYNNNPKGGLSSIMRTVVPSLRGGLSLQRCSKKETCSEGKKSVSVDLVKFKGSSKSPSADLAYANKIYDKCCINFTIGQDKTVPDALSNAWLGGDKDANFSGITCGFAPPEEVSMYDGATKEYSLSSRMRAFYVETFSGYAAGGFSRPPYCASGNASSYVNHMVLQNNAPRSGLAHELGHILLNDGSHPSEPKNLMGPSGGSVINDTQCKTMYNNA